VWPRTASRGDRLSQAIQEVVNDAVSITAVGAERLPAYLEWAIAAASRLQPHLGSDDIDRLIRTSTFWAAVGLSPTAPAAVRLVNYELLTRERELLEARESIDAFRARFLGVPESALLLIPDTNVLIAHAEAAETANWRAMVEAHVQGPDTVRLVVPLVVIDELDKLKHHTNAKTRSRARVILKLIHRLLGDAPGSRPTLQTASATSGAVTIELVMESPGHIRLPRADDELVDVVSRLRDMLGERTVLATFDTGADLRAAATGIKHVRLEQAYD
jgi:hypothetical protein